MSAPTDRAIRELCRRVARSLVEAVGTGSNRSLIVAISGGPDSSAMLLALADTRARHGWALRAAHVDHRIQSAAIRCSFRESAAGLALAAGAQFDLVSVDAKSEADASSAGLEAAAREVRYRALAELALKRGSPAVAVAHTRDDQAETVLLHLLRGSGLDGLSGMPSVRNLANGVRLARPLLDLRRTDADAICDAYGWSPAHDPSNDDPVHARNRVRKSLLPQMAEFNPNVAERLADLARSVGADRELLDLVGSETLGQLRDAQGAVPRREFLLLPGPLQVRVIRSLCREHGLILSAERTGAALQVILHGHGVVELAGRHNLSVARGTIRIDPPAPPGLVDG